MPKGWDEMAAEERKSKSGGRFLSGFGSTSDRSRKVSMNRDSFVLVKR